MPNLFRLLIFCACVIAMVAQQVRGQNAQEVFGKNRVQHKTFDWEYISSSNFDIYYYAGGKEAARIAGAYAEAEFNRISELIGFSPYTKIKLYIYNSKADLLQSNVGLDSDNSIVGGKTNFHKSIIEIPFPGNQIAFKQEISAGIAQTLVYTMMYGGSFKDMVQSSYLLTLPDWFMNGAIRYAAEGWSVSMDDHVRDAMLSKNLKKPSSLTSSDAPIVGQSIWNFIAEKYGRANIANILNLTRILRNEETSIASTLGVPYDRIIRDWRNYYFSMSEMAAESFHMPERNKRLKRFNIQDVVYNNVRLSSNGQWLAYSENNKGRYRIVLRNMATGHKKTIYRTGHKVLTQRVDYNVPLLVWQGSSKLHAIVYEQGQPVLWAYALESGSKSRRAIEKLGQISAFDVSADGKTFVLSADKAGQNDIFLYNFPKNSLKQVTNDLYDDMEPRFLPNSEALVFSSNRTKDTLASKATALNLKDVYDNYNIFSYDPVQSPKVLQRLTNTLANETKPMYATADQILYLSDESGIINIKRYDLKTRSTHGITDYRQSILDYDWNPTTGNLVFVTHTDGKQFLYAIPNYKLSSEIVPLNTRRQELMADRLWRKNSESIVAGTVGAPKADSLAQTNTPLVDTLTQNRYEIDIRNYVFESEKIKKKPPLEKTKPETTKKLARDQKKTEVAFNGPFPYQARMSADEMVTSLVVDQLRGAGIWLDAGMTDMFENHKIRMGGLLPTSNMSNYKLFGEYALLKNRLDWKVRFERDNLNLENEVINQRHSLTRLQTSVAYPLSPVSRIALNPFFAQTRFTNLRNANADDILNTYAGLGLEFVFDNTMSHGMNILEGTRMKAKIDQYNATNDSKNSFGLLLIDIRHYQRLHKEIIFAVRASHGNFFGNAQKNFLLGGMDNWLFNRRSEQSQNPSDPFYGINDNSGRYTDWLFMQYVTNMRGFNYNTMYGNKYLLFNAELRIPLFRYLHNGPITSNFLRHFQLVAFTDAGTAWTGSSPYSESNVSSRKVVTAPDSKYRIEIKNYQNPFLTSYGGGVRSVVLGYYTKFDVAWGVKDYKTLSPAYYVTLGYDF